MHIISTDSSSFASVRVEALFTELVESFRETGGVPVSGTIDALEQAALGNGEWGLCYNEEAELGIWVLAEEGTLIIYGSGEIINQDFEFDEADFQGEDAESEDKYDLIYNLLAMFLPEDMVPEKLPFDEDAAGEKLSKEVDEDDDNAEEEDE